MKKGEKASFRRRALPHIGVFAISVSLFLFVWQPLGIYLFFLWTINKLTYYLDEKDVLVGTGPTKTIDIYRPLGYSVLTYTIIRLYLGLGVNNLILTQTHIEKFLSNGFVSLLLENIGNASLIFIVLSFVFYLFGRIGSANIGWKHSKDKFVIYLYGFQLIHNLFVLPFSMLYLILYYPIFKGFGYSWLIAFSILVLDVLVNRSRKTITKNVRRIWYKADAFGLMLYRFINSLKNKFGLGLGSTIEDVRTAVDESEVSSLMTDKTFASGIQVLLFGLYRDMLLLVFPLSLVALDYLTIIINPNPILTFIILWNNYSICLRIATIYNYRERWKKATIFFGKEKIDCEIVEQIDDGNFLYIEEKVGKGNKAKIVHRYLQKSQIKEIRDRVE